MNSCELGGEGRGELRKNECVGFFLSFSIHGLYLYVQLVVIQGVNDKKHDFFLIRQTVSECGRK